MEKKFRMWLKAFCIIVGLLFFCFLAGKREPGIDYEKEARIRQYEEDESVTKIRTTLLAYGDNIQGDEEEAHNKRMVTTEGVYTYEMEEIEDHLFRQVTAYIRDNRILEVTEEERQEETILPNVWISEVEEDRVLCFLSGSSFYVPYRTERENREQVADIVMLDGVVSDCRFKKEKITGKLLGVTEEEIRLEGQNYPLAEDVRSYRLYGELEEITLQDLPIGYGNTDYVIEDGKICACLVSFEENMETIRVLIQSGNYNGRYHESVLLSADCAYTLQYGEKEEQHGANESVSITNDSSYFKESERVTLTLSNNTGKIILHSIQRGRGQTDYRGSMEILKTDNGLAVINELLLEEYLYGVVPSEMPASYPPESLKAQAVCARTYAYRNMEKAGLPELGAHVDDSTAFQVYGNTEEKAETTAAVKATKGKLLLYEGELVNAYYYSTSCGYGTDMRAWNGPEAETLPYLQAKGICKTGMNMPARQPEGDSQESDMQKEEQGTEIPSPEALQEEEAFAQFIAQEQTDYFECEEAWYRWKYIVDDIDVEEMERRLSERYAAQPQSVLTEKGENDYISQKPEKIGELREISIIRRNAGGNAAELLIEGSEGTYLVRTEYNIRYILNNGQHYVIRKDGSEIPSATLLPSAFFTITTGKEEGNVIGYSIAGGGYGHGIGMSQNGARNMALSGMTEEEILLFFYEGSYVETVY